MIMFRNVLLAGLLTLVPGCLKLPEWQEPPGDAGGFSSVANDADKDAENQDGKDDVAPDAIGGTDVSTPDVSGDVDASRPDAGFPDSGVPADPCYHNSFDNIASLAQFVAQSGRWSIHPEGYLQQTQVGGGPQGVGYFDIGHFVNNQVRLRVRIPPQETGSVFAQLLFRYTRQSREGYDSTLDHGYTLQIEGNERFSVEDFYQRRLATAEVNAAFGEWHDLMLQILGDQIVGFLGGEEIIRFTDGTYIGGKIGLSTHSGMVDFDDLEICPLERIINPPVADASCVALYHFDEPNPYRNECIEAHALVDDHGTQSVRGRFGQARYFNGETYFLGSGNMTLDLANAVTVEAWIKPELAQDSFNGAFGNIFSTVSSGEEPNGYYGFVLWMNQNNVNLTLGLDGRMFAVSAPVELPTGRYTHIAGTYNGTVARVYVDGKIAQEVERQATLSRIPVPDVHFGVGTDVNGENAFRGTIDEVRVSNIAREF